MEQNFKKIVAGVLASVMVFSFAGCNGGKQNNGEQINNENKGDKLFAPGTEISIVIGSHPSWPFREDWKMWHYFQEATGAKFNIQSIPDESYNEKIPLLIASPETLPDLMHIFDKRTIDSHCLDGAFISLTDNMDKLPNFNKFFDSLPETERDELLMQRSAGDGKIYLAPVYGTQTVTNLRTWMYRKDIFDKNKLTMPTSLDEMYDVCLKLKELYPTSYPLCFRQGLGQIDVMGPVFHNDFSYQMFYDFKEEKWKYGAAEDTMLDVIAFFHKMYDKQLVPPDFLTINDKSWEELVSTDRGFIMPEYLVRLDFFNLPNRQSNPDYTWAIMDPPKANTPNGVNKIAKWNMDPTGYTICNTGKQNRIDNAIKLLDWMYSDKGSELLSWGKLGESYEVVNGEKQFIGISSEEPPQAKYGVGTYGLYQRTDPASFEAIYSKEQREQGHRAYNNTEEHVNPTKWLSFNPEELKVSDELDTAIRSFTDEELSKFLMKLRPMSEWDAFQKDLKDMGLDRLIAIHESAFNRAQGK